MTDEDVDRTVADLREKAAEYVPVEGRPAADGDYVVIELQGKDAEDEAPDAGREGRRPRRPRGQRSGHQRATWPG